MAEDNVKAQMRKGILEYCILAILSREDSYAPKYYTLTDKGREYLATLDETWDELVGQIRLIRHGK